MNNTERSKLRNTAYRLLASISEDEYKKYLEQELTFSEIFAARYNPHSFSSDDIAFMGLIFKNNIEQRVATSSLKLDTILDAMFEKLQNEFIGVAFTVPLLYKTCFPECKMAGWTLVQKQALGKKFALRIDSTFPDHEVLKHVVRGSKIKYLVPQKVVPVEKLPDLVTVTVDLRQDYFDSIKAQASLLGITTSEFLATSKLQLPRLSESQLEKVANNLLPKAKTVLDILGSATLATICDRLNYDWTSIQFLDRKEISKIFAENCKSQGLSFTVNGNKTLFHKAS